MDINYEEVIDFSPLKRTIEERGLMKKFVGEKAGVRGDVIGRIYRNVTFPKTDLIARICSVLGVPPSKIVAFKLDEDGKKKAWFDGREPPFIPPANPTGELTYDPLWQLISLYLNYINEKKDTEYTANDLFDKIEPFQRRNGLYELKPETIKKALAARGYPDGYKSDRKRHYEAKGLIPQVRTKLRHNRPLNIRTVYDICNFFGCSIDWVMSYK